jgi:hypothetical protein
MKNCSTKSKWRDTDDGFASVIEVLANFKAFESITHPSMLVSLDEETKLPQTRVANQAVGVTWRKMTKVAKFHDLQC